MKNPENNLSQLLLEIGCNIRPYEDLLNWAELELTTNSNPHPAVFELFALSQEEAIESALKIAKDIDGFTLISGEGEQIAIKLVNEYCRRILDGDVSNADFCTLIRHLEDKFMHLKEIRENAFQYPPWLGQLWNCCDYFTENIYSTESIVKEAKRVLEYNYSRYGK